MKNICLYFQIHHPLNYRTFRFFEIGESKSAYDDLRIENEILEAAVNFYIPTNDFLINLIHQTKGQLKLTLYISGTSLDLFALYSPKLLNSFRQLADTGLVEFAGGTASHSVSSIADRKDEFRRQIKLNKDRITHYFGRKPKIFANTDLLFTNQIAEIVAESGYPMILANGSRTILQWRSPNYLYSTLNQKKNLILFRNETISNEFSAIFNTIATTGKNEFLQQFLASINGICTDEPILNIYLNYSILAGIRTDIKRKDFRKLVFQIIKNPGFRFGLPSEVADQFGAISEVGTDVPIFWTEHDHPSYFSENDLQREAIQQLFKLEKRVTGTKNIDLRTDWQYLQTSDHFHLMNENHPAYSESGSNGYIYKSNYDAFINYMNILEDFKRRLIAEKESSKNSRDILKSSSTPSSHQFRSKNR